MWSNVVAVDSRHSPDRYPLRSFSVGSKLSASSTHEAIAGLRKSTMFKFCSEESLTLIASKMRRVDLRKNEVIYYQGDPTTEMFIITRGAVSRTRLENNREHEHNNLGAQGSEATIGGLHLLLSDPYYSTVRCTQDTTCYALSSVQFHELVKDNPTLAKEIIYALAKDVLAQQVVMRTALLSQSAPKSQMDAPLLTALYTSVGATVESFYRSALNAQLNATLTGQPVAAYFPQMHVQLPLRVAYINGFKGLRLAVQQTFHPDDWGAPGSSQVVGASLAAACLPGVLMSPISGLLEASNAGHSNPAPLATRWLNGAAPRMLREIIFGIGINQLSEWCEERVPEAVLEGTAARNFVGSMSAGVACGYLSHIPHNLSALKLLQPHKSYAQHFGGLVEDSAARLPLGNGFPRPARWALAAVATVLVPKGVAIRSTQIAGSFAIINGTINLMARMNKQ
jgi:CRP-like cAMP-binding protein